MYIYFCVKLFCRWWNKSCKIILQHGTWTILKQHKNNFRSSKTTTFERKLCLEWNKFPFPLEFLLESILILPNTYRSSQATCSQIAGIRIKCQSSTKMWKSTHFSKHLQFKLFLKFFYLFYNSYMRSATRGTSFAVSKEAGFLIFVLNKLIITALVRTVLLLFELHKHS
jgi:hypothetical protein